MNSSGVFKVSPEKSAMWLLIRETLKTLFKKSQS